MIRKVHKEKQEKDTVTGRGSIFCSKGASQSTIVYKKG